MIRSLLVLIIGITANISAQHIQLQQTIRFLALGDSYTIGESVPNDSRWPAQLKNKLIQRGYECDTLSIIAATGWTTSDLINAIEQSNIQDTFNLVSLLIGVNNQFNNRSIEKFAIEFEELLLKAIEFANNINHHVFVLSIPDYYFTPWGQLYGSQTISDDIENFNQRKKTIAKTYGVPYIYVTDISRNGLNEPSLVASDGLHPSGKQYKQWTQRIIENIYDVSTFYNTDSYNDLLNIYFNNITNEIIIVNKDDVNYTFELFTLQGKKIRLETGKASIGRMNVAGLQEGIYIYRIIYTNKHVSGKIFIN